MKNYLFLVLIVLYPIINSFKTVKVKAEPITKIHYLALEYMDYSSLSEWNQLRYNLANSIKKVHGDLNLYDSYCKVLNCESAGWKNSRNPTSSASGLFQCMKGTFKDMKIKYKLGITFNDFRNLPLKEQAKYFDEYLNLYKNKHKYLEVNDQKTRLVYAYLMVLNPSAVGYSWESVVFKNGTKSYAANKGIPHKGDIKIKDIYKFCLSKFK